MHRPSPQRARLRQHTKSAAVYEERVKGGFANTIVSLYDKACNAVKSESIKARPTTEIHGKTFTVSTHHLASIRRGGGGGGGGGGGSQAHMQICQRTSPKFILSDRI